ncbi:hypothetical protein [Demequina gelatinilytica]|uniref:hypothetical protein n=1 Tax=Demequina gelatinilytica TaxID=1638980 RepID=UPI0007864CCD|nr:hypothetical protein [Demequina gelatinilytica]
MSGLDPNGATSIDDPTTADAIHRASLGQVISLEDVSRLAVAGRADLVNLAHREDRIDTHRKDIP